MSLFAEYIAWAIIVIVQIGLFMGSVASFYSWKELKRTEEEQLLSDPTYEST
jgi:hypothetical protein